MFVACAPRYAVMVRAALAAAAAFLLAGCERLPTPQESHELVVGIREAPAYFQAEGDTDPATGKNPGPVGYEHDLIIAFAQGLGLEARFVVANDPRQLRKLVADGKVHLGAALPLEASAIDQTTTVRSVGHWVVGAADGLGPDSLEDLAGRGVQVIAGSPLALTLRALAKPPEVVEVPGADEMDLLQAVADGRASLAAVNEIHSDLAVNFFPELKPLVKLPGQIELGWRFPPDLAAWLKPRADEFIDTARKDGTLARIHDRYFGHIKRINATGSAQFLEDIRTKLPAYRRMFESAEEITGIDWRLLAALAYQESKWDPLATSYTNVRGMMMLTEDTADLLKVKNRLDPAESIRAGALYYLDLIEQVPESTPYPDRLWMALSAYNLGMGHFRGSRAIARMLKRDPDSWYEMKQVLPQLARPEIYARLKSGRARGGEAVIMVENIRTYFDILARFEAPHTTPFPKPPRRP